MEVPGYTCEMELKKSKGQLCGKPAENLVMDWGPYGDRDYWSALLMCKLHTTVMKRDKTIALRVLPLDSMTWRHDPSPAKLEEEI